MKESEPLAARDRLVEGLPQTNGPPELAGTIEHRQDPEPGDPAGPVPLRALKEHALLRWQPQGRRVDGEGTGRLSRGRFTDKG